MNEKHVLDNLVIIFLPVDGESSGTTAVDKKTVGQLLAIETKITF